MTKAIILEREIKRLREESRIYQTKIDTNNLRIKKLEDDLAKIKNTQN